MSGVAIGASDPSLEGAVVFADESTLLILLRGVRGAASFLPSLNRTSTLCQLLFGGGSVDLNLISPMETSKQDYVFVCRVPLAHDPLSNVEMLHGIG